MKLLAAAVLILGSLLFLCAAALPVHAQTASITLNWTNSADDSLSGGPCIRTAIRWFRIGSGTIDTSTAAKKLAFWDQMTEVPSGSVPVPTVGGTSQSASIVFSPGSYLFNIRQKDDADNWSGMSNFVTRTVVDATRPAPVRIWVAP